MPELPPTEIQAVTAIAYLQPATRAEISRLAGKEISRDVIGHLKRLDLIDGALRAPEPGAPFACVTTKKFLKVFGFATLRDLPDIERLEDEGLLQRPQSDIDLDGALGLVDDDGQIFEAKMEFEDAELEDRTDDA
jgi:chromosome segregation and condensation protein ScpB